MGLYWGYIGIMEKKMETTIMENHKDKKMENEMETGIIMGYTVWALDLQMGAEEQGDLNCISLHGSLP